MVIVKKNKCIGCGNEITFRALKDYGSDALNYIGLHGSSLHCGSCGTKNVFQYCKEQERVTIV